MLLLAMKGLSGCGKSTLSRALSKQLGWPLIDADTPITKGGIAPYTGCNPPFCDRFNLRYSAPCYTERTTHHRSRARTYGLA